MTYKMLLCPFDHSHTPSPLDVDALLAMYAEYNFPPPTEAYCYCGTAMKLSDGIDLPPEWQSGDPVPWSEGYGTNIPQEPLPPDDQEEEIEPPADEIEAPPDETADANEPEPEPEAGP